MENPSTPTSLHRCGCCKQQLPIEAFYINQRTLQPDNYCKECRKASSRTGREKKNRFQIVNTQRSYPVITRIQDRATRLELIRHALQVVRQSTERKRKREYEYECMETV